MTPPTKIFTVGVISMFGDFFFLQTQTFLLVLQKACLLCKKSNFLWLLAALI